MPLCFEGILRNAEAEHVEMIGPKQESHCKETELAQLLAGEAIFAKMPLPFATFPAIALRLPRADAPLLKSSLARALEALPILAGRCCQDGRAVALAGQGVPFTVVQSTAQSAPETIEESKLLEFAHFVRPGALRAGREPLMTVKLTIFRDQSAIMTMCRAHLIFDGSSAWQFLAFWSSLARGEAARCPRADRDLVRALLPSSEEQLQELSQKAIGRPLAWIPLQTWALQTAFKVVGPCIDTLFLNNLYGLSRHKVFFSDDEAAAIKAAATPPVANAGQDAWVTTQEALTAYLLLVLGRHLLPAHSKGKACVMFFLDSRKCLGLPSDQLLGSGLNFMNIQVSDLLCQSLPGLAACLHEGLTTGQASSERQRDQWVLLNAAAEKGMEIDAMQEIHKRSGYDIMLAVNNQSKRQLPDFGEASGGCAEAVITNAGPNIFLPAKGGLEVHLGPEVFSSASCSFSGRRALRAIAALREELPQPTAERPCLLQSINQDTLQKVQKGLQKATTAF